MGTRGLYGFYKNGTTKVTYNHYGSYPSELGNDVVKFIRESSIAEMNHIFDSIILVDGEESKPTTEQIKECINYYDREVSTGKLDEWYCLLRKSQGDLNVYKNGLKYMIDGKEFINDSLFCEYVYIINLDENVLEFYVGFNKKQQHNRYSVEQADRNGYYACRLIAEFDLNRLDEVVNTMAAIDEDRD